MGRSQEVFSTISKYGIDFTAEEGATAMMLTLHHGQDELAAELLKRNASIRLTDSTGRLALDYLLHGYYKNTLLKHQQVATSKTLRQFLHASKPKAITMEIFNHQLHIGGNSMLFFLVIAIRTMEAKQPHKIKVTFPGDAKRMLIIGAFDMDDAERLASLIPDEILPPYRKNRTYINSILASNEISRRALPGCKPAFQRVQRGWYILNPDIKWHAI